MRTIIQQAARRLMRAVLAAALLAAAGAAIRALIGWASGEPGTPGIRMASFDTFPPVPPATATGNGAH
ncbi:MAG TPA: hypothetical protein VED63_02740 [Acidimicrobiales bacterium]|nr:hypothetical protein [Acidimicrobiales bacterium]